MYENPIYNLKPENPFSGITDELRQLNVNQQHQAEELRHQASELQKQVEQLQRQADIQKEIEIHLKEEAAARSKDDKKYFWLGVLTSFIISMLVAHSVTLMQLLLKLLQ